LCNSHIGCPPCHSTTSLSSTPHSMYTPPLPYPQPHTVCTLHHFPILNPHSMYTPPLPYPQPTQYVHSTTSLSSNPHSMCVACTHHHDHRNQRHVDKHTCGCAGAVKHGGSGRAAGRPALRSHRRPWPGRATARLRLPLIIATSTDGVFELLEQVIDERCTGSHCHTS
jgi:hypothetical protein